MSLSDLIKGHPPTGQFATATVASGATMASHSPPSVAKVASVTVATVTSETAVYQPMLLSVQEEKKILRWLAFIGEDDPILMRKVLHDCCANESVKKFFLERAMNDLPEAQQYKRAGVKSWEH